MSMTKRLMERDYEIDRRMNRQQISEFCDEKCKPVEYYADAKLIIHSRECKDEFDRWHFEEVTLKGLNYRTMV